jgi:tRNA threonylcarbamoyladenosine biosynthesis protein TsaE
MDVSFTLHNISKTAKELLTATIGYKVLAFHGEMGAGKTTLIHALCEAMGVKDAVTSPTFSIINQYKTVENKIIFHIDLYRIKDEEEAINAGIEDCLYSGNICLVEWPERVPSLFPDDTLHLFIEAIDANTRRIDAPSLSTT